MQVNSSTSLTDLISKAPITPETVSQFRNQALQVIDHAVDVFFKPTREDGEGHAAKSGLLDLELALRTYQQRATKAQEGLQAEALAQEATLPVPQARTEALHNAPSLSTKDYQIKDGTRTWNQGDIRNNTGKFDNPAVSKSLVELVRTLSDVIPIYNGVVMEPGPLSATVLNHIKQTMQFGMKGSSFASKDMTLDSFSLLKGFGRKSMVSSSSSTSSASASASSVTADERVMNDLSSIRLSIDSLKWADGSKMTYTAHQSGSETENITVVDKSWWPWGQPTSHVEEQPVGGRYSYRSNFWQEQATWSFPYIPPKMDTGGVSTNQGLTHAAPGQDLVDLVDKSDLTPELVDQLKARGGSILDNAEQTFFNRKREHGDGQQSYHELINLRRALNLAADKWSGSTSLRNQVTALDTVLPLYACVARTPGELSSSVRNFAKDIADFRSSQSSSTGAHGSEEQIGLFGISQTTANASSGSQSDISAHFETTTTDQRVAPKLHSLQVQLAQLQIDETNGKRSIFIPAPMENATRTR